MERETQKARVLPIIQIQISYQYKTAPYSYEITLTNSGSGIAYVRNVRPKIDGSVVTDFNVLQDAVMNGGCLAMPDLKNRLRQGF